MQADQYTFSQQPQEIPQAAKKWNWGAFFLSWIWGIGNSVWISFLAFVPIVNLAMPFVLGIKGGEWAWKNKEWQSVEHFEKVQRTWAIVGLIYFIICVIAGILVGFLFTAALVGSTDLQ